MSTAPHAGVEPRARARLRVRVRGTVQGVGFRPFVYRLAGELGLGGFVLNDEQGVLLEVEGEAGELERFESRLASDAPPLAVIEQLASEAVPAVGERGFRIAASTGRASSPDAPVTPDSATCPDCLAELRDPADRRYRYPFINCTNCGPRFTIVRGVPYDRPMTTMAGFRMCPECEREYDDPGNRRFHAQPNACPRCGPRAWLHGAPAGTDPVAELARMLRAGAIAAIKGIGGFHLACDAADQHAVAALRARKHREDKPFALMVGDLAAARRLVIVDERSERLLGSVARPIVLAPRLADAKVAAAVARGAPELGVMLPYSPLHHLLLSDFGGPLVMTSGNVSDEPIAYEDEDALERLASIADVILLHDREIHARTDDSVVRATTVTRAGAVLRRSRGYVPAALALPIETATPLLACGAEQKSTFCVARGSHAWVSHHIGDLEHYSAYRAFCDGIEWFERLFAVRPELVVHDRHPGYLSTSYALELAVDGLDTLAVQHHHAHLAACLAEHGHTIRALGAIFDGTGYGTDGTVWGGELLIGDLHDFERAGALFAVPLPGGAAAIREPWRMALSWLAAAFGEPGRLPARLRDRVDAGAWSAAAGLLSSELSPLTSSVGRLFDAVAALCGIGARVSYEGQAAVELEWAAATSVDRRAYELELRSEAGRLVIDPRGAIRAVLADLEAGDHVPDVALRFHRAVAAATAGACARLASARGLETVVLSGGVFQNRIMLELVAETLGRDGLRVLVPERLPANDGGISYGQAAVAAARIAGGTP